jgi:hypothetical protein
MPSFAVRRDTIHLTDEKLERSRVLKILLDIMYSLETTEIYSGEMFTVLDLADKWDSAHVRHTIRRDLSQHDSTRYKSRRFHLSIRLKDPGLIAGFPRHEHDFVWSASRTDSAIDSFRKQRLVRPVYDEAAPGLLNESFVKGGRLFDAATWSYGAFLLTPPTVLWALLRATYVGTTKPAKIDHEKVADEFERLLTLACKSSKDSTELIHRRAQEGGCG